VELSCHGGRVVLGRVLRAVVAAGARPAGPGEFTLRAFLNGRMDLAQAEAVQELIAAESELGARVAAEQLSGRLSRVVGGLRDGLVEALAEIEAAIDFPDEDIDVTDQDALLVRLRALRTETRSLLETFEEGRRVREGVHVVIAGRPNVGKSSLMNALLDEERAIVTAEPGTTRDVLRESLIYQGVALTIADTAGIRAPRGAAETEGVRRSREALAQADLVLFVLDGSAPLDESDRQIAAGLAGRPVIAVLNKSDLPPRANVIELGQGLAPECVVQTSALKKTGLHELKEAVVERAWPSGLPHHGGVLVTQARHRAALVRAEAALGRTADIVEDGAGLELAAVEAREALDALGEIIGAVTTDDILNTIFSKFCIGK
ncbi:MAG: tRNA uridine-5-carboxymethylaminomethyl(34) synthesis GTPase MnmE, partial [Verrucomicrobia bacterium]|nr:tRNA uridine-5-carboxymethylaminomethyl(34) synthesis GTPase MnmE [Verrucomicrobiota bacterium]